MFLIILLLLLVLYLLLIRKRQILKGVFSLAANAVSFAEALFLSVLTGRLFGRELSGRLADFIWKAAGLQGQMLLKKEALERTILYFSAVLIGIFTFYAFYLVCLFINAQLKKLLFSVIVKERYRDYCPEEPENDWLCTLPGLLSFFITTLAFLFPIAAVFDVVGESAQNCGVSLPRKAEMAVEDPAVKVYSAAGGRMLFNGVAAVAGNICGTDKNTVLEEVGRGFEIVFSGMNVLNNKEPDKNLSRIRTDLEISELWGPFISEVTADAAYNLSRGQDFLGIRLTLPKDRSGRMIAEVLEIVSGWEEENLLADIDTAADIYALLQKYNIRLYGEKETLSAALAQEEFSEKLIMELFSNKDFQETIPVLLRFGLGSTLDAMNMEMREEYIVLPDLTDMTEEEMQKEAEAFSVLLQQLSVIADAQKQGSVKVDFLQMITDIQKLMESKLLSNVLLNLIIQVLYGLILG